MRDTAFKMFVIMRQPVNILENLSQYMESFFTTKTYLDANDPVLFDKITKYLIWIKQNNYGDGIGPEEIVVKKRNDLC